jgi:peptidoglycan/xylan/chitin deacetylase (PgdA/CDA1 family)
MAMDSLKKRSRKKKWIDDVLKLVNQAGVFNAIRNINPEVLTVLNYHRVDDVTRSGFDSYAPNVSATSSEFIHQINFIQHHYNVITCEHLSAWLRGERKLPPHSALITFDDGYADNYVQAFPILRAKNLPAIIFLTTDHIGNGKPLYWDYVAYCFVHSQKKSVNLPLQGPVSWNGAVEQKLIIKQWIERIKQLPEPEKRRAVSELADVMEVVIPDDAFLGLYLSWDQVREMSQKGIEFGSHTTGHPILTRIPILQVKSELAGSKQKIEMEIQKPVIGFAYPNGGITDFSPTVMDAVRDSGYKVAFSLMGGAMNYSEVRKQPLAIRRIFLSASDTFSRFVGKLSVSGFVRT